jgi:hypothetical protein
MTVSSFRFIATIRMRSARVGSGTARRSAKVITPVSCPRVLTVVEVVTEPKPEKAGSRLSQHRRATLATSPAKASGVLDEGSAWSAAAASGGEAPWAKDACANPCDDTDTKITKQAALRMKSLHQIKTKRTRGGSNGACHQRQCSDQREIHLPLLSMIRGHSLGLHAGYRSPQSISSDWPWIARDIWDGWMLPGYVLKMAIPERQRAKGVKAPGSVPGSAVDLLADKSLRHRAAATSGPVERGQ